MTEADGQSRVRLLLMADGQVGHAITQWLVNEWRDDLVAVVTTGNNEIAEVARTAGVPTLAFEHDENLAVSLRSIAGHIDLGLLAWWPMIVGQRVLSIPEHGFINTHPSLLPHNRGKHYNFWAIVEQAPFGVTLHKVDEGVDTGDVVAQALIPYGWEDTGKSLYEKASAATIELVRQEYERLRSLKYPSVKQSLDSGSFHRAKELDQASRIDLDKSYTGRELLNLLRARTFLPHPACWFSEDGVTYEVRVEITRRDERSSVV